MGSASSSILFVCAQGGMLLTSRRTLEELHHVRLPDQDRLWPDQGLAHFSALRSLTLCNWGPVLGIELLSRLPPGLQSLTLISAPSSSPASG